MSLPSRSDSAAQNVSTVRDWRANGPLFPYITIALCCITLFANYKLTGSRKLEELQAAAWNYLSDVRVVAGIVSYLKPIAAKSVSGGADFSGVNEFEMPTYRTTNMPIAPDF